MNVTFKKPFTALLLMSSIITFTKAESTLLQEPSEKNNNFVAHLKNIKESTSTKENNTLQFSNVKQVENLIPEELDTNNTESKGSDNSNKTKQGSSLNNLEKALKDCIDDAIKAKNKEQLDQLLKNGLIDKEQMFESLKKMVQRTEGPQIIDAFEQLYEFSQKEKIALENALEENIVETIFYWSLEKRKPQTFKKAFEINSELSSTTLNKLKTKVDDNCNSSFKNLETRKKACQEFNDLMKFIMASQ